MKNILLIPLFLFFYSLKFQNDLNCEKFGIIFFKADSFVISNYKLNTIVKYKDKFQNRIIRIKIISKIGEAEVEIIQDNNITHKGNYIENILCSTDMVVCTNDKGEKIGYHGYTNIPCKNGIWQIFKGKKLIKTEFWKCDSLLKTVN